MLPLTEMPYLQQLQAWQETLQRWPQENPWLMAAGVGGFIGLGALASRLNRRPRHGYGSAHWATYREMKRAGLFKGQGMLLAKAHGHYIRSPREQNVVVFGPPGEGKSSGIVLPTLLTSPHSIFCLDLSGELVDASALWRRRLFGDHSVYIWRPHSTASHHINPFDLVRWETHMVQDVQRIANHTVNPGAPTKSSGSEFYQGTAKSILALGMMVLGQQRSYPRSFAGLLEWFSSPTRPVLKVVEALKQHPVEVIRSAAALELQTPNKLRDNWKAAAYWLTLWRDEYLALNTSDTTIPWQFFQQGERPMTIYFHLTPDDANGEDGRLNQVLRMLIDMFILQITNRPAREYRHEGQIILDDIGTVGYFPRPEDIAASKRKYGLRLMPTFQSTDQVLKNREAYKALLSCCGCWVIYRQNEPDAAAYLARKFDRETVVEDVRHGSTIGEQIHGRPLISAGELGDLEDDEVVCAVRQLKIRATRINVYTDPFFQPRLQGILR